MSTIQEIRRANLLLLLDRYPTIQAFADAVGRAHSQISAIKNANKRGKSTTPRTMGDDMARAIEEKLKLDVGWMDAVHSDPAADSFIRLYNQLPPDAQAAAQAFVAGLAAASAHPGVEAITERTLQALVATIEREHGEDHSRAIKVATTQIISGLKGGGPPRADSTVRTDETVRQR